MSKLSLKLIRISTQKQSEVRQQGGKVVQSSDCRQLGTLSFTIFVFKKLVSFGECSETCQKQKLHETEIGPKWNISKAFFENLTDQVQHVSY